MASVRRAFTDEFKAEAARLVTVEGYSARQVARDLGIHDVDDASQVEPLLDQIAEPVEVFMGDGGYDRSC